VLGVCIILIGCLALRGGIFGRVLVTVGAFSIPVIHLDIPDHIAGAL